nr:uncharacterized protein LOC113696828 [Coffea arabica]
MEGEFDASKARTRVISHPLVPVFLVHLQMGEKRVDQVVIMNTGSSLFWVQCEPFSGMVNTLYTTFNPSTSGSYDAEVDCDRFCAYPVRCQKDFDDFRSYEVAYLGGYVGGLLAYDDIVFKPFYDDESIISDVVVGCTHNETTPFDIANGVLGLGATELSLVSQLRRSDHKDGALIDTGSSVSFLQDIAYNKLVGKIAEFVGTSLEIGYITSSGNISRLCFKGHLHRDFEEFPIVTFHFEHGTTMRLDKGNIFTQSGQNLVCLNVVDASQESLGSSLIGVNLQQFHYVSYDILNKEIGFMMMDCRALRQVCLSCGESYLPEDELLM